MDEDIDILILAHESLTDDELELVLRCEVLRLRVIMDTLRGRSREER